MTVDALIELLDTLGGVASEEAGLTELDHALQCAWVLAGARPDDVGLQLAGLCHDIGHRFGPDAAHGRLGADALRPVLGERVAGLVEAHVPAKRYLVATEPGYALSPISVMTLSAQGGAMDETEAAAFAATRWCDDAIVLRRADEAAKVPGRTVPGLERWIPLLRAAVVP